jgi:uncharacterized protein with beta-barrel porin domain
VSITSTAPITTTGTGALGIIVQSIGGGGGVAQEFGATVSGTNTAIIGAAGSATGIGGTVSLSSGGTISTTGTGAHGILAQSIGGGGGFIQAFDQNGAPINLAVSAGGGGSGNGGTVSVTNTAAISTTGAGAYGIIAQSIGGGGGLVGSGAYATTLTTTGPFAGTAGGTGSGNTVGISTSANISATGLNATAIFGQSVGGSGGNTITVNVTSGVVTGGYFSGSPIPVAGNAIALSGGLNNTITNSGTLTTVSGTSGMAITGGGAANAVTNSGLTIGSVDLCLNGGCNGTNSFDNAATGTTITDTICTSRGGTNCSFTGAIFDPGATVDLGDYHTAGNLLSNNGLISPGGYFNVVTTQVTGNFTQSSTGVYGVDLNFANQTADRINITGTATVIGTVKLNIMNAGLALTGTHDVTILTANAGVTNYNLATGPTGLALDAVETAVAQYTLTDPDSNDINLHYGIDFSPAGLTTNQHAVGNIVNAIQSAGNSPNFAPLANALFNQPTVASLGAAYDSISGEGVSGVEQTTFTANELFMNAVSRQQQFWLADQTRGPNTIVAYANDGLLDYAGPDSPFFALKAARPPSWRVWAEAYGDAGAVKGESPLGSAGLNYGGGGLMLGADYQARPDFLYGFAAGGNLSSFDVPDRSTSGGIDGGQFAAYAAKQWGALYATGLVGFGLFENNEQRTAFVPGTSVPLVPVPSIIEQLSGAFLSQTFNARFEAGWRSSFGSGYATPFAALEYSLLHLNGFSESDPNGPNLLGLSYASQYINSVPLFLGTQFDSASLVSGNPLSYFVRVAWRHDFEPYRSIESSFIAAPGFDFTVNGAIAPQDAASINIGAKYDLTKQISIMSNFEGLFSGQGNSYGGTVGAKSTW